MTEKITIIGSSGFIGNDIKKKLLTNNFEVFDPNSNQMNLLNTKHLKKFSKKFVNSSVIYCAGKHKQYGDTVDYMINNILGMKNLLEVLNPKNINQFIFLSSAEVYGKIYKKIKLSESASVNPENNYSLSKFAQEIILKKFFRNELKKLIILRLPGIYGPKDNNTSIISKIIKKILNNEYFNLTSNGNDLRDYVYVGDLSKILVKIINSKQLDIDNNILNICSGAIISINKLINLIEKLYSKRLKIKKDKKINKTTNIIFKKNTFLNDIKFTKLNNNIKKLYLIN